MYSTYLELLCLKFDSQIKTTNGKPTNRPDKTTALEVNGIAQFVCWYMKCPSRPFLPIKEIRAIPATVGGSTIGASTNGLIKPAMRLELFANTQAKGTPKSSAKAAESVEVQSDNLIAVKSESALKNLLQGTFANNETRGATITTAAAVARVLVASPNFTLLQNPLLARI